MTCPNQNELYEKTLVSCRNCNSTNIKIRHPKMRELDVWDYRNNASMAFLCECQNCGRQSRRMWTQKDAAEEWNRENV